MSEKRTVWQFERRHNVRLVSKKKLWWARALGKVWPTFLTRWWTTVRLPFCKGVIAYPVSILDPLYHQGTLEHELVHVEQQRTTWGLIKSVLLYFLFPLPVYFSGRWFLERPAYLKDILSYRCTVGQAVDILWVGYLRAWPKPMMKKWFVMQIKKRHAELEA